MNCLNQVRERQTIFTLPITIKADHASRYL
jgi:hypothetical protein